MLWHARYRWVTLWEIKQDHTKLRTSVLYFQKVAYQQSWVQFSPFTNKNNFIWYISMLKETIVPNCARVYLKPVNVRRSYTSTENECRRSTLPKVCIYSKLFYPIYKWGYIHWRLRTFTIKQKFWKLLSCQSTRSHVSQNSFRKHVQ